MTIVGVRPVKLVTVRQSIQNQGQVAPPPPAAQQATTMALRRRK
jgi:hypothetical protein